jgi:hypothetical protein
MTGPHPADRVKIHLDIGGSNRPRGPLGINELRPFGKTMEVGILKPLPIRLSVQNEGDPS